MTHFDVAVMAGNGSTPLRACQGAVCCEALHSILTLAWEHGGGAEGRQRCHSYALSSWAARAESDSVPGSLSLVGFRPRVVLPAYSPPFLRAFSLSVPAMREQETMQEGVKTENDHINLKVAGQDGSVVQFKIKRYTPLNKLMKAYCDRQGLSMRQIRFRFDGQPINETDTPAQLEMEDEDTIDVFQQQTGGVC
ncbi:small ubiquitin-related modifier 3 isoform X1 [Pleurodeles waltl]|uniref:small ubiquitin-related modifier 3 isoform X1 n=1 Tax=Pleurodeles waltl TaxID=8319 RepID=UPI0037096655